VGRLYMWIARHVAGRHAVWYQTASPDGRDMQFLPNRCVLSGRLLWQPIKI
jgi:hypothetical protein